MNKTRMLLIVIVILGAILRLYRLDSAPPSISWDEAAVGYNGWVIANWGRDEYGKFFPAYFRSFGDDKHPVHVYLTAISVKFLGLSEFSTRLPSAFFGILNVLLVFALAKLMFSSETLGLFAAFFLAISPYNIHFSRFNHEANFALFFFMLGLLLFYKAIKISGKFLPWSVVSFGICFITYHPSKIMVPLTLILLIGLYGKQIIKDKTNLVWAVLIAAAFSLLVVFNLELLGGARIRQTSFGRNEIEKTKFFQVTRNELLGRLNIVLIQYSWLVSPNYLFLSGDKNPRLSDQATGQFYKPDVLFLLLGAIYLILKRSKEGIMLLAWALIAPLPSALVGEAPHGARGMFMMGSWHLVAAWGFYLLFNWFKKPLLKMGFTVAVTAILLLFLSNYLKYYYNVYIKKNAIDWQYGMKQVVDYFKSNPQYTQVFMTDVRSQPYIFFLYYLKTPLPEYLNSVIYNRLESKSYNTVSNFNDFYFGGWDPVEIKPNREALYVLTSSQYDGLRYKYLTEIKKIVYYPNDTVAFFIVSEK